ncbi:MAG: hypothetical protein KDA92_13500, partial [Planctomycetales bacterium]|nr:hypothetical protein [Planctomycetales bacterium]
MLQVIQGATSDTLAELHFKWPDAPSDLMARLSAKGPFCRWARTLPARFAFEQIRDGWWRTQIVDPCFWSPDYPGVYRLEIDGQPIVQQETTADLPTEIAVRRFGARGNQLFWNGKRCVLRGQLATNLTDGDHATDTSDTNESLWTTAYRELMLGRIDSRYCPTRAAIATRDGVWLGLRIDAADHWQSQLQQITKSPALILVVLPGSANIDAQELAELAPNLLKVADLTNLDLE